MPETDITKMKVADLKRELKLRGLAVHGNKNELQERLQTALIEGDISLEDSAIADTIDDDDVSLDDEDEHKLLGDEHDDLLLKSPVSTPTATTVSDLLLPLSAGTSSSPAATTTATSTAGAGAAAALPAKKIVLKRNNSQLLADQQAAGGTAATPSTAKENAAPGDTGKDAETKTKHKPIVVGNSSAESNKDGAAKATEQKANQLSAQERLELRAKKFGITATTAPAVNKSSSASIVANKGNKETEEQQKEALKRRAERFGCVVPEKNAKTLADERLEKRKERFGAITTVVTGGNNPSSAYAEKARARLERFKTSAAK